ncbi:MAG: FkbM family methyltransferase [Boseongicola sp.]|nr:FkbM family methyltransferase [Boseongicola sp.]MDD9979277.1 FkbM family methyltransferase [Boseongicola sp.]
MVIDKFRTWNRRRIQRYRLTKPVQDTPYGFKFSGLPSMLDGTYEADEFATINRLFKHVDIFVEAGAHYGFYVCAAQKQNVSVLAFEPVAANVAMISKNLAANGWGEDVVILPVATGYDRGFFNIRGGGSGGTLAEGYSSAPESQLQMVPVVRLDDVVHLHGRKALILMDVEGFELNTLRGAERLIASDPKPIFVVEVFLEEIGTAERAFREDYLKVFDMMTSAGYQVYHFEDGIELMDVEEIRAKFEARDPSTPSGNFVFAAPEDAALLTQES